MSKVLLVLALSGCSVALQSRPTAASSDCSTSHAYWIADAVGAVAGAAAVGVGLATEQDGYLIAGTAAVASVIYLASAHNGYKWRARCANGGVESVAAR